MTVVFPSSLSKHTSSSSPPYYNRQKRKNRLYYCRNGALFLLFCIVSFWSISSNYGVIRSLHLTIVYDDQKDIAIGGMPKVVTTTTTTTKSISYTTLIPHMNEIMFNIIPDEIQHQILDKHYYNSYYDDHDDEEESNGNDDDDEIVSDNNNEYYGVDEYYYDVDDDGTDRTLEDKEEIIHHNDEFVGDNVPHQTMMIDKKRDLDESYQQQNFLLFKNHHNNNNKYKNNNLTTTINSEVTKQKQKKRSFTKKNGTKKKHIQIPTMMKMNRRKQKKVIKKKKMPTTTRIANNNNRNRRQIIITKKKKKRIIDESKKWNVSQNIDSVKKDTTNSLQVTKRKRRRTNTNNNTLLPDTTASRLFGNSHYQSSSSSSSQNRQQKLVRQEVENSSSSRPPPPPLPPIQKNVLEFVHIPKTGGSAIEYAGAKSNILWGLCHWQIRPTVPHCIYADWEKQYQLDYHNITKVNVKKGFEMWHTPPKWFPEHSNPYTNQTLFTVVRNPYERYISEYYCPYKGINPINWDLPTTMRQYDDPMAPSYSRRRRRLLEQQHRYPETPETLNRFLMKRLHVKVNRWRSHYVLQSEFIYGDDHDQQPIIHHILKYENLQEEFHQLMKQYYLPIMLNETVNRRTVTTDTVRMTIHDLYPATIRQINKVAHRDFVLFGYEKMEVL